MKNNQFRRLFRKIDFDIFLLQVQVNRNIFEQHDIVNDSSVHPWDKYYYAKELEIKNNILKKKIKNLEDIKTIISCG